MKPLSLGTVCALALVANLVAPAWGAGKRYAVLVGVKEYQHPRLIGLEHTENDVTELAELLGKYGYEVTLLCDALGKKDRKRAPTKTNVERELKRVLDGCKRGDLVLVAFSGHGLQFAGDKDSYFCPVDARPLPGRKDTLVSLGTLYRQMNASFAGAKLMIVDACRDDPAAGRGARGIDADSAQRPPRGVAALFSCSAGERAFESDKLGHGVFFHFVLKGLRGEARDSDGDITFSGLSSYITKRVPPKVAELVGAGAKQSPNIKADISNQPVLARVGDGEREGDPDKPIRSRDGSATYRVVKTSGDEYKVSKEGKTGTLWEVNNLKGRPRFAALEEGQGGLYVATGQAVHMFDARTGKVVWRREVPGITKIVLPSGRRILVVHAQGRRIFSLDLRTGKILNPARP